MPSYTNLILYATVKATAELERAYDDSDTQAAFKLLAEYTRALLKKAPYDSSLTSELMKEESFRVVGIPSKFWKAAFVGDDDPDLDLTRAPAAEFPNERLIVYQFVTPDLLEQFLHVVEQGLNVDSHAPISAAGVDLGVGSTDHWCPASSFDTFGTRADARLTVAADVLPTLLRGQRVNVVIIDAGLHQASIPPNNWGGGLSLSTVPAGSASRTSHGMMIARTILDLAPDAVLYDVPLIPERITTSFLSTAHAAYIKLLLEIVLRQPYQRWAGPWILVNAWAVFDRSVEPSLGNYTENKNAFGHPLINVVKLGIQLLNVDVIFAAGNCGEFCGSRRCGGVDRGPGRSIWGANALPEVITAGAVLTNEMWAGYSSQGRGPNINGLAHDKPDLCAPSNFREINDAAVHNTGTSTACAMTAGIVAALRSKPSWHQNSVSPQRMLSALTQGARKTQGASWNGRLGHGILNAAGAMNQLP